MSYIEYSYKPIIKTVFVFFCFFICKTIKAPNSQYIAGSDILHYNMSLVVIKPDFCICENKDADQLRCYCAADQRLCFRYMDSTIPLLSKSEISSLQPSTVGLQSGLRQTWSETPKTGFLTTRLICTISPPQN